MRIRKRCPAATAAAAAALSVPDPQHNRSPVLQPNAHENPYAVQEAAKTIQPKNSDPPNQPSPPPGSQETTIGSANPGWVFLSDDKEEERKQKEKIKDERWSEEQLKKRSNDARKERVGAELNNASARQLSQPSASPSSSTVVERGYEYDQGDKVVPLKKRKGSFESINIVATVTDEMKSKTNKKCLVHNDEAGKEGIEEIEEANDVTNDNGNIKDSKNSSSNSKKSKRGSVIMEGSRCSRVNGRGWRCCQPTLVGYSLCEHHLGKGRLRNMTSVRNSRAKANGKNIGATEKADHQVAPGSLNSPKNQEMKVDNSDQNHHENEKPMTVVAKKRVKLGMVKARSISSLLGQTDNTAVAANGDKDSG